MQRLTAAVTAAKEAEANDVVEPNPDSHEGTMSTETEGSGDTDFSMSWLKTNQFHPNIELDKLVEWLKDWPDIQQITVSTDVTDEKLVRNLAEYLEGNIGKDKLICMSLHLDPTGPTGNGGASILLGGASLEDHALVVSKFALLLRFKVGCHSQCSTH